MNQYLIAYNLFWINYLATTFMVGLIWYVQIVHYPLFHQVGLEHFKLYADLHRSKTTLVVFAPMLLELFTAVLLVYLKPAWLSQTTAWVGLILVGLAWLMTLLGSIPDHQKLSQGYNSQVVDHLVLYNWLRTTAWTARWILLSYPVYKLLQTFK